MSDRSTSRAASATPRSPQAAAHDPLEGIDADGRIVTGARRDAIPAVFAPVLDEAAARLHRLDSSSALYVYGSVATGRARVGASDVDLVTIGIDAHAARRLGDALSADFDALCRRVDVGAAYRADYAGDGDRVYGNRVFLRHYCVHVSGPEVGSDLPAFPADVAAARGFNGDIGLLAERWRADAGAASPAALARRVARKTLFAVAGLVGVHDAVWTTDRVSAARRWAVLAPRWAPALDALVAWGDQAVAPARTEIVDALDGVVAHIVETFRDRIGLWDSTPPLRP